MRRLIFAVPVAAALISVLAAAGPATAEILLDVSLGAALLVSGLAIVLLRGLPQRDRRFEAALFFWAYALRVAAVVGIYQFGLVKVLGDDDSSLWVIGPQLANHWARIGAANVLADALGYLQHWQNRGHLVLYGLLFYGLGDSSRIAAGLLNAWFGSLTVVLTYKLALALFGRTPARYAASIACVVPSLIVWSGQTLKEPIVIFFEVLALYATVRLQRQLLPRHVLALCASVLCLITLRFYASYIVAFASLLGLIGRGGQSGVRTRATAIAAAIILVPALSLSGFLKRDTREFTNRAGVESVVQFRRNVSVGDGSGSAVANTYDLHSPVGFAMATVVGATHLLLAPFPWQFGAASLRMLLTAPEMVAWWWLVWFAILPGLRRGLKDQPPGLTAVLVFTIILGLIYSVMFANIGLVFRQRAQLLPFLLAFAGLGLAIRVEKRRAIEDTWASDLAEVVGPGFAVMHSGTLRS